MAPQTINWLRWIVLLPLMGAIFNGFFGGRASRKVVHLVACGTIGGSFLLSVAAFFKLRGLGEESYLPDTLWRWFDVGGLQADLALSFDRLSAVMALVITGVGALIHIYSTGYMAHDKGFARYFAYLNLFCFAMLTLVLGANLPLLFVGWEGVGLCSYLLIGFWYEDDAKASAGKKAFIVNRVGDLGFIIGIFILFWATQDIGHPTLTYTDLQGMVEELGHRMVSIPGLGEARLATVVCLCFLVGAMGKSAQIPLYVWLPDAMAGPTPVSALIHAATMVTAGVYMFCRMNFLLSLSETAQMVIAGVGGATALFAATIGLVQNDIKKVLAYSTVSQLGFMFLAVGAGAFAAAMFHLVTHAFFKACLFLGSGSVIHGMHDEQDIRKMGGLREKMPITHATFLLATLAIAGFPLTSGFFSKDEILWTVFNGNGLLYKALYGIGLTAAFCTAFYMARLTALTFWGKTRADPHTWEHVHESPVSMTGVLAILAVLSILGGFLGMPHVFHMGNLFASWLEPVWSHPHEIRASAGLEWSLMGLSVVIGLAGLGAGAGIYLGRPEIPARLSARFHRLHRMLLNKYYVDELYEFFIINPIKGIATLLWKLFDVRVVDGLVNGAAWAARGASRALSLLQSGNAQTYGLFVLFGVIILVWWV